MTGVLAGSLDMDGVLGDGLDQCLDDFQDFLSTPLGSPRSQGLVVWYCRMF
jgi:hypothetical protein